jgi:hypothetical protein
VAVVPHLKPWLPAALTDAPDALVRRTAAVHYYLRAVLVRGLAATA